VPITPKDITTLTGNNWLNDAVMDGYLALVNDESFETSNFTIYFYRALMNKTNEEMLRWTKKTSLFGTRLVHIPVNDSGSHWCMATIDHQEKTVTVRDSIRGTEGDVEIRYILENIRTMMGYHILMTCNPADTTSRTIGLYTIALCQGRTTVTTAESSLSKLPDTSPLTSPSPSPGTTCNTLGSGCSMSC
jgi:hypothetical protein